MNDKRSHKRFKVNGLEVNGTIMFTKSVKVIDISMNGVSLESTNRLNPSNSYRLRLKDKDKTFSLTANVIWSSLIESRKVSSGNVVPVYKVGMNFIDTPHQGEAEFLNFILESQRSFEDKATVSKSGSEILREFLGEAEHKHNFRGSIAYHKAPGIADYPSDKQSEELDHAATTDEVSLVRLIVPQKVLARAGEAVMLNTHAVAASKAGNVPVTVALMAIPVAGVKVLIHPANITKEVDRHTDFCFNSRIVCSKCGTWPVKWNAKISSSKVKYTASNVLTGTTNVVCRNA